LQAARELSKMRRHIEAMEDNFYRAHYEQMFEQRFAAFQKAGLVLLEVSADSTGADDESSMGAEPEWVGPEPPAPDELAADDTDYELLRAAEELLRGIV
jgi:hypothetical protein